MYARALTIAALLLVGKVTVSVVAGYKRYLPPDFEAEFLLGREAYFWGAYSWAFYTHLAAGPITLVLGTLLISPRFRQFDPGWHRRLGRVQAGLVLLCLVPSGLWMAWYAMTGAAAAWGLGTLALATGLCIALGWRAAVERRFVDHEQWMWRTYLLLCSAVVIRLLGGLATVAAFDALWFYPFSVWTSWVVPLAVYEILRIASRRSGLVTNSAIATGNALGEPTRNK
jgi:hypothetical protein